MTNLLAKIEKHHWVANEHEVETLSRDRYTNAHAVSMADGTYLKVILVASQAKLGPARRSKGLLKKADIEAQAQVLTGVHDRFYPHVLKGITTEDIANEENLATTESRRRSLERNRRSAFARSAKSTLLLYVEAGGDLRTLDAAHTSKESIRKALAPPEPTDRIARQIQRSQKALMRAIARQVRRDPVAAETSVNSAMAELQAVLDALEGNEVEAGTTTVVPAGRAPAERAAQRTRVGVPMLNRGA